MSCCIFQTLVAVNIAFCVVICAVKDADNGQLSISSKDRITVHGEISYETISYAFRKESLSTGPPNDYFSNFRLIGGIAFSRPSCVSWGKGISNCMYRGKDSVVFHQTISDDVPEPRSLGGNCFKDVQCLKGATVETIDCIISDSRNRLYTSTYKSGVWSAWTYQSGGLINEVGRSSCTKHIDKAFVCLVRVWQQCPARFALNSGIFSGFMRLTGCYHSAFSCCSRNSKNVDCFAMCYDNTWCSIPWRNPGSWGKTIRISEKGYITSEPTTVVSSSIRFHSFSTTRGNRMVHLMWNAATEYSKPVLVGDLPITDSPDCVAIGTNVVHCFALGMNNLLYKVTFDGTSWGDWTLIGINCRETPSCVRSRDNEISCFMRLFDNSLGQAIFVV